MSDYAHGMIVGLVLGGAIGVFAMAIVQYKRQPDDDPEYWFKQLGRRSDDK